jgi:hypothetical protein
MTQIWPPVSLLPWDGGESGRPESASVSLPGRLGAESRDVRIEVAADLSRRPERALQLIAPSEIIPSRDRRTVYD